MLKFYSKKTIIKALGLLCQTAQHTKGFFHCFQRFGFIKIPTNWRDVSEATFFVSITVHREAYGDGSPGLIRILWKVWFLLATMHPGPRSATVIPITDRPAVWLLGLIHGLLKRCFPTQNHGLRFPRSDESIHRSGTTAPNRKTKRSDISCFPRECFTASCWTNFLDYTVTPYVNLKI